MKDVLLADGGVSGKNDVRAEGAAVTKFNLRANVAVGVNDDIVAKGSAIFNDGRGVDFAHGNPVSGQVRYCREIDWKVKENSGG